MLLNPIIGNQSWQAIPTSLLKFCLMFRRSANLNAYLQATLGAENQKTVETKLETWQVIRVGERVVRRWRFHSFQLFVSRYLKYFLIDPITPLIRFASAYSEIFIKFTMIFPLFSLNNCCFIPKSTLRIYFLVKQNLQVLNFIKTINNYTNIKINW